MSTLLPELQAALANANVRAFLRVIREGETDQTDAAYFTQVGGRILPNLDDHPRQVIAVTIGGRVWKSSAAGAYQFLMGTWDECAAALSLPDFSPPMQDLAAVFLIRRRGALADVIAGRLAEAIRKTNKEWASLPGSPYGQPTKSLDRARAVYAQWGGQLNAAAVPPPEIPAPVETPPAPTPERKSPMAAAASFAWGLASSLINMFAPLAREKITKEVARHSDNPMVAEQVASAVIEGAKALTGKADPVDAVATAKADPEAVQQLEMDALAVLDRLAPVLDKVHQWDKEAWQAEEASRTVAAERAAADPQDMAKVLTVAGLVGVGALIVFVAVIAGVQMVKNGKADTEVWALLVALATWAMNRAGSIYDYRFGSSRGSGAKDVVIETLSRKGKP